MNRTWAGVSFLLNFITWPFLWAELLIFSVGQSVCLSLPCRFQNKNVLEMENWCESSPCCVVFAGRRRYASVLRVIVRELVWEWTLLCLAVPRVRWHHWLKERLAFSSWARLGKLSYLALPSLAFPCLGWFCCWCWLLIGWQKWQVVDTQGGFPEDVCCGDVSPADNVPHCEGLWVTRWSCHVCEL